MKRLANDLPEIEGNELGEDELRVKWKKYFRHNSLGNALAV